MPHILHIDSSARFESSVSRKLSADLVARLSGPSARVTVRDLAKTPIPQVDAAWQAANFTDEAARSAEQRQTLALSDTLIAEIEAADILVIGAPVYNFSVPAALKAWIDNVARARKTFRYTPTGPEGLLTGKKVYLVVASGGTEVGGAADFATPYMKFILGFIGLTDVTIIAADRLMMDAESALASAHAAIEAAAA
jgi:FMN-dependent NADH-azoreductase